MKVYEWDWENDDFSNGFLNTREIDDINEAMGNEREKPEVALWAALAKENEIHAKECNRHSSEISRISHTLRNLLFQ